MRFDRSLVLMAIPVALALFWLIARRGRRTVPVRQHRWAVVARMVVIVLVLAAAAGPYLVRSVSTRSVLFMVDRSESIGAGAIAAQEEFLADALDVEDPSIRAGVAVFANEVRLDRAVGPLRPFDGIRTEIDTSATDLTAALTAAGSLLPTEGSRRVVVLTDAVPTSDGSQAAADELGRQGIAVDFVTLDPSRSADVLVESVQVPAAVRTTEEATVTAVLRSNQSGPATVTFTTASGAEFSQQVTLQPGRQEVTVSIPATEPGFEIVRVRVSAPFDTRPENDGSAGVFRVIGPARIAVVEGVTDDGADLARALEAGGVSVDRRADIPGEEELLAYDAVVLVNFPRPTVAEGEALASFVEDLGRGLVVVGGDRAFGMGDYHETPLETVLPVSSNPDDLVRRQPVAEVLVIDTSGSMGACHCSQGDFAEGGTPKTDIAKAGAAAAIEALSPEDSVGVVAVAGGADWVLPLQQKPDGEAVDDALAPIVANGDTEIARGLQAALDELDGVDGALRHIVLFTDGWDPNEANLVPLARQIADRGITLSVLGTGEGSASTLRRMADVGGGRFYPGSDLNSVPEIFVEETLTAARGLINEGSFIPALAARSVVTDGLEATPPLLGYVATKAKATASTALQIGPGDPLLASWQRGLGRATVWTSDATSRWSAGWITWDGYVEFWGKMVRQVLPAGRDNPPEVTVDGNLIGINYEASEAVDGGAVVARVRSPDGETQVIPLSQTGERTFSGTASATGPGAYWVAVTLDRGDGTSVTASAGAVSAYAPEFSFREPDLAIINAIAETTGGRLDITPGDVFDEAPTRGASLQPIASWLLLVALGLFLLDVALRRLVFSTEDTTEWRQAVQTERRRERQRIDRVIEEAAAQKAPAPTVSESETLERLMRRKRR